MVDCASLSIPIDNCEQILQFFYDADTSTMRAYIEVIYFSNSQIQEYVVYTIESSGNSYRMANTGAVSFD